MSIYDIDCIDLAGKPLSLGQFKSRPMLIVNTASLCGFTPQTKGLEDTWQGNQSRGLVVLGVPSGDFGGQEYASNAEIGEACSMKFRITFPMLAKTHVKGPNAHPLFKWLAEEGGFWSRPRWNFYKYLIGADGRLKTWFTSLTSPEASRLTRAVAQLTVNNA